MVLDNTFWAMVGFFVFVAIILYIGVPKTIAGLLDKRIKKIEDDLSEAKRLREEAQALMAEYERKRKDAESEAEDIVGAAHDEAKRLAEEADQALKDLIARRTKTAEDKIALAEAQAVSEVRAKSADVAIEAARVLLAKQMEDKGAAMVDQAIADVAAKLN